MQKVQNKALFNELQMLQMFSSEISCLVWTSGPQISVHNIRMEWGRCVFLLLSVGIDLFGFNYGCFTDFSKGIYGPCKLKQEFIRITITHD